jgi:hypothetical protein
MTASQASCKAIWLCNMLVGLFVQEFPSTIIHYDNQSCMRVSRDQPSMEGSRRLWPPLFCGLDACLEEGAL